MANAEAVNVPLNVYVTSLACVPLFVLTNILSPDVIDPISESSITTKAELSAVPEAERLGLVCKVNVPSVSGVVPV